MARLDGAIADGVSAATYTYVPGAVNSVVVPGLSKLTKYNAKVIASDQI